LLRVFKMKTPMSAAASMGKAIRIRRTRKERAAARAPVVRARMGRL
jgi:hypothetical protein